MTRYNDKTRHFTANFPEVSIILNLESNDHCGNRSRWFGKFLLLHPLILTFVRILSRNHWFFFCISYNQTQNLKNQNKENYDVS